jgi:hypothetical protein
MHVRATGGGQEREHVPLPVLDHQNPDRRRSMTLNLGQTPEPLVALLVRSRLRATSVVRTLLVWAASPELDAQHPQRLPLGAQHQHRMPHQPARPPRRIHRSKVLLRRMRRVVERRCVLDGQNQLLAAATRRCLLAVSLEQALHTQVGITEQAPARLTPIVADRLGVRQASTRRQALRNARRSLQIPPVREISTCQFLSRPGLHTVLLRNDNHSPSEATITAHSYISTS